MQLFLIRHLPTEWNRRGVLQGSRDITISMPSPSILQKIAGQRRLLEAHLPFDLVACSGLKRTKETAQYYGFSEPVIEPLLNELDFGIYEGKSKQTLIEDCGSLWSDQPRNLVLGEKLEDFENRIFAFLEKYSWANKALVFGHGSWIRAISSIHETGSINTMNKFHIENNALVQLNFDKNGAENRNL